MDSAVPVGPLRFDFTKMHEDDFEEFCFLVLAIDHPTIFRLRAPDGGVDAAVSSAPKVYERCWQFKRFTGHLRVSQCVESLDAAVARYGMAHYTFCFARDLTGKQEKTFAERIANRHPGVDVDWIGETPLIAALVGSEQGDRIRRRYFNDDPAETTRQVMAAIRAGGAMETGEDAIERLRAITKFLDTDPIFAYQHSSRPAPVPSGSPPPGTMMSLEVSDGKTSQRFDAIPRNHHVMQDLAPGGRLSFSNTAEGREALDLFRRGMVRGEEVTLARGVTFEFDRMPDLFKMIGGEPTGDHQIILGPSGGLPPWNAHVEMRSAGGDAAFDIDLRPDVGSAGWDIAFVGETGMLTAQLLFRRTATTGQATMNLTYHHDADQPWASMVRALDALAAAYTEGTVDITDRDGNRPALTFEKQNRTMPEMIRWQHWLAQKMASLEAAAGVPLKTPDPIGRELYMAICDAAAILEKRGAGVTFRGAELDMPLDRFEDFSKTENPALAMSVLVVLPIPGADPPPKIGTLFGELKGCTLKGAEPVTVDGEERVRATIAPKDETSQQQQFAFRPAVEDAETSIDDDT